MLDALAGNPIRVRPLDDLAGSALRLWICLSWLPR